MKNIFSAFEDVKNMLMCKRCCLYKMHCLLTLICVHLRKKIKWVKVIMERPRTSNIVPKYQDYIVTTIKTVQQLENEN